MPQVTPTKRCIELRALPFSYTDARAVKRFVKSILISGVVAITLFSTPAVRNAYRVYRYPETYQQLQGSWASPSTFPAQIPADARHAQVYRYDGWGQGGSFFQLRYQLPSAAFQALVGSVASQPQITTVSDPPRFYTGGGGAFPAEFTIYTFTDAGNINHGFKEGIALNPKDGEVVHWHESW